MAAGYGGRGQMMVNPAGMSGYGGQPHGLFGGMASPGGSFWQPHQPAQPPLMHQWNSPQGIGGPTDNPSITPQLLAQYQQQGGGVPSTQTMPPPPNAGLQMNMAAPPNYGGGGGRMINPQMLSRALA